MEPTPALLGDFVEYTKGEKLKQIYSRKNEIYQQFMNYLANATIEELKEIKKQLIVWDNE